MRLNRWAGVLALVGAAALQAHAYQNEWPAELPPAAGLYMCDGSNQPAVMAWVDQRQVVVAVGATRERAVLPAYAQPMVLRAGADLREVQPSAAGYQVAALGGNPPA